MQDGLGVSKCREEVALERVGIPVMGLENTKGDDDELGRNEEKREVVRGDGDADTLPCPTGVCIFPKEILFLDASTGGERATLISVPIWASGCGEGLLRKDERNIPSAISLARETPNSLRFILD